MIENSLKRKRKSFFISSPKEAERVSPCRTTNHLPSTSIYARTKHIAFIFREKHLIKFKMNKKEVAIKGAVTVKVPKKMVAATSNRLEGYK